MKKVIQILASAVALVFAGTANAALPSTGQNAGLVGVVQTFPDVTFSGAYLMYDNNGVDADTGLLSVFANAATLNEGAALGNSSQSQSYLGSGDSTPNRMLTFQIANGTGSFAAGTLEGGNVTIGFGNTALANTTNAGFSWQGNMLDFGFLTNGTQMDAGWRVTSEQYQALPGTLSQFTSGYVNGRLGGIKINSSAFASTSTFNNDWLVGSSAATTTLLNSYMNGTTFTLAGATKTNSTVLIDVFTTPVPEPETYLMMTLGLAAIARLRKAKASKK